MNLAAKFKENLGIIAILIVGVFLRFYHLGFQSAGLDEVLVLKEADPNSTFQAVYDAVLLRDSTSFLHIFSIHYLGQIWEHNIFLARSISAIAGVLSIYYIYKLGIVMLSKRVGYLAAMLLTLNLYHIEYSQEARSYSLFVLFVILAFYRLYLYFYNSSIVNAIYLGFFMGLVTNAHPIGLLNVASIFLILFLIFVYKKDRESRIIYFKGGIISAIVTLAMFYFIFPIVLAASKTTSFWIPEVSFYRFQNVFTDLAGRSNILLWLFILAFAYFTIHVISEIKKNKASFLENKVILSYLILLIWIGLEVVVILIKSITSVSILLSRYMISIMPAIILILAFGIEFLKNKVLKYSLLLFIIGLSVYNTFFKLNYYNTITKQQFEETADLINKKNTNNDKIVGRYGYILSYYINKENSTTQVLESSLENYILAMKNNSITQESFWYFDGNSAEYNLSPENQKYLANNFNLKDDIQMFDSWAKHFIIKKASIEKFYFNEGVMRLFFKNFNSLHNDTSGNIMMYENSIVKSNLFSIPEGSYTLILNGNSTPNVPIDGENARLKIRINDKIIANIHLSENPTNTKHEVKFKVDSNEPIALSIEFYNDTSKGSLDRNVILYDISILK